MLTLDKAQQMVNEATNVADVSLPTGTTYTLSELANYLKTSENRVRHWEGSYSQFLSKHRNQYNHRVFTDADVRILERVKFLQDSGLYTKQGIVARLKSKVKDSGGVDDKEYKQRLLVALNTLATEIRGLRREVREDLPGSLKNEIGHLSMLLFPPEKPKKWWQLWGK